MVDLEWIRKTYPAFPAAGPSGSEITDATIESETAWDRHERAFAPRRPEQEYEECDWDEWGEPVNERTVRLTDEQYAAALARWEAAMAEFKRTGGVFYVKGPTTHTARVKCKDGTEAEAVYTGKGWLWISWSMSDAPAKKEGPTSAQDL